MDYVAEWYAGERSMWVAQARASWKRCVEPVVRGPAHLIQLAVCLGLLLVALPGCSGSGPVPRSLPDLHLPNTHQIPGIVALEQRTGADVILGMSAYRAADAARTPRVLFLIGTGLYDVGLDGSGLHAVPAACGGGTLAVTPNGKWLACRNDSGIGLVDLTAPTSEGTREIIRNAQGNFDGSPAWAPDGQQLAIISHEGGGCSIAIYDGGTTFASFNQVALLVLSQFAVSGPTGPGCSAFDLHWSPDGNWLSFVQSPPGSIYLLSLASLAGRLYHSHQAIGTIQNTNSMLSQVTDTGEDLVGPAWSADSQTLTFVSSNGWDIEQINIHTYKMLQLLTQRVAGLGGVSSIPSDQGFVFVLGVPSGDVSSPPAQLYVFTPPHTKGVGSPLI